jgi:MFS family permease
MEGSRAAVRRLAGARAISVTGSQVALIALTYRVYEETGSAVWVSAVFLATFATLGVLTPIGGWLGDRFDRRRVMIASDLVAAGAFACLVAVDEPWLMIALALVATAAEAPFLPASQAAIPNLAARTDLAWANGLVTQAYSFGITAGPLIGGVLVGAVGAGAAFGINAVSFVVSALLVASVRAGFQERRAEEGGERIPLMDGVRLALRSRLLRIVIIAEFIAYSAIGWAMVSDAPLADQFGTGAIGFAVLVACWGAGMLIGSWACGRWMGERPIEIPVMLAGMLLAGAALVGHGVSPVFWAILAVSVLGGAGSGAVNVARQTLIQRSVPDRLRARIFAVAELTGTASFALGLGVSGPIIESVGVQPAYILSGLVFAGGSLILLPLLLRPERGRAVVG